MFKDKIRIKLAAGRGGDGAIAWRHEKYIPKGGPYGGDGGDGGSIIFQATGEIFSLEHLKNYKVIKGENGKDGSSNNKKGRDGKDLLLKIPMGTVIKDAKTKDMIFDITKEQRLIICRGGKGGKGNSFFKSPTNRAPHISTRGIPGEKKEIELELKLIADVGLVGMPNAGKSTLLSKLTRSKAKIASYPFTTLTPNLGFLEFENFTRACVADIPGIIENAHQDKGLGLSFIKHIERTKALIYVIDIAATEGRDPFTDFSILQKEIKSHNQKILKKPFLVALNKIDEKGAELRALAFKNKYLYPSSSVFEISSLTGKGITNFISAIYKILKKELSFNNYCRSSSLHQH